MAPTKTFTFHIAEDMKAALAAIKERDGIAEGEQIRRGVQMWLDSRRVRKKAERKRADTRSRS